MTKEQIVKRLSNSKIAVLMGGTSGEREVSFRSGRNVLDVLERNGLFAVALDPADPDFLDKLKNGRFDLVFIALHGQDGEDGKIQGLLDLLGLPYTGSGVLASALSMNKVAAKRVLLSVGVPTPEFLWIDPEDDLEKQCRLAARVIGLPLVLKPTSEGSSLGVSIIREFDALFNSVSETLRQFGDVFLEKYISGREVTVGILGTGSGAFALPILELVPKKEFYDYEAKYTPGMTKFILPAPLPDELTNRVQEYAVTAHRVLGCRGMSRVDFQIDHDGNPFVTEVNTIPGLTDLSDLPAQAECAGISYDELIFKILESAL